MSGVLIVISLLGAQWVETTQQDFADGWYEVNLYSSHRQGGAVEFSPRWDANNDGAVDIATVEMYEGPTITWGNLKGIREWTFTRYPSQWDKGAVGLADLDTDGYTDLVSSMQINFYWGSADGPSQFDTLGFVDGLNSLFFADFNKDGYLDIALDFIDTKNAGIFWGTHSGFDENNYSELPADVSGHNIEAADINKDGWLDVVLVNCRADFYTIYWGAETGFSDVNRTNLPFLEEYPVGCSIADLDDDGWLDIILTGTREILTSWIYWGPDFGTQNKQVLYPGRCQGGSAIADINNDELLDIVYFRGDTLCGPFDMMDIMVFWGDGNRFETQSADTFGAEHGSSGGGLLIDFDYDGYIDILSNLVGTHGNGRYSFLYMGPDFYPAMPYFGISGGSCGIPREPGNVYTREYEEEYTSSVFDAGEEVAWQQIAWSDSCPGNSSLTMSVRTGPDTDTSTGWSDWTPVSNPGDLSALPMSTCIQYKAMMEYPNPAWLPVLWEVRIDYGVDTAGIVVAPDQDSLIDPGGRVDYPLVVRNMGNQGDVIDLSLDGPSLTGWSAELLDDGGNPLLDPDADGNLEVGPVAGNGGEVDIILRISAPSDAVAGEADTTRVVGESNEEPGITDLATLITTVRAIPGVDIEPNAEDTTNAGTPIRYAAQVTNLGNLSEVISLQFHPGHAWSWTLYDSSGTVPVTDAGQLDAYGGSSSIWVELTPPDTTPDGTVDTSYLTAYSSYDNTVRDSIQLITTVPNPEAIRGVLIEPDQSGTVEAGQTITYPMYVVNLGNEVDDFTLWSISDLTWPSDLATSTGQLAPAETLWLDLSITPPAELASIVGDPTLANTEHRVVWAKSVTDPAVVDSAVVVTLAVPPPDIHNFPNPFGSATTFIYSIPSEGEATLSIYNRAGEHMATLFADEPHSPGIFTCFWDGCSTDGKTVAPGVYLYSLTFTPDDGGNTQQIIKKALAQP